MRKTFAEFFAGGGMVSKALGPSWDCVFANDFDPKKAASYRANHKHKNVLKTEDIAKVGAADIDGAPALIWGSSPCQDLSVAGRGKGLRGQRSGTYHEFWRIVDELCRDGRDPEIVAVENVVGTLQSNGGDDFAQMCAAFAQRGYRFGAMIIDAARFVPQSRPRLFIVGVSGECPDIGCFGRSAPADWLGGSRMKRAFDGLPRKTRQQWVWWDLPEPSARVAPIARLVEENPGDVAWHSAAETAKLVSMMSATNLEKLTRAKASGKRQIGFVYKRTRADAQGQKVQRAEVRFDGLAGCLRTPGGGSSRQLLVEVNGDSLRSRLLGVREAARLMGLKDSYALPASYNEGYHLMGDGVVVPVVKYLDAHLFSRIASLEAQLIAAE